MLTDCRWINCPVLDITVVTEGESDDRQHNVAALRCWMAHNSDVDEVLRLQLSTKPVEKARFSVLSDRRIERLGLVTTEERRTLVAAADAMVVDLTAVCEECYFFWLCCWMIFLVGPSVYE